MATDTKDPKAPEPVVSATVNVNVPDPLAGIPRFDVDADIAAMREAAPQQYDAPEGGAQEPEGQPAGAGQPPPAEPGTVTPKRRSMIASAKMAVATFDHLQRMVFKVLSGADDDEQFRFDAELKGEMEEYTLIGIEESGGKFRMPWWIPLLICVLGACIGNFVKMKEIKKARKEAEKAELERLAEESGVNLPGMRVVAQPVDPNAPRPPMRPPAARQPMRDEKWRNPHILSDNADPAPAKAPVVPGSDGGNAAPVPSGEAAAATAPAETPVAARASDRPAVTAPGHVTPAQSRNEGIPQHVLDQEVYVFPARSKCITEGCDEATGPNGFECDSHRRERLLKFVERTEGKSGFNDPAIVLCKMPGCIEPARTPKGYCGHKHATSHTNLLRQQAQKDNG